LPTYEYRCLSCDHQFERFQRMSDEPVNECEACGSSVRRLLFPVAIHFKGSGFYSTDYARKNALGAAGTHTTKDGGSESSSTSESAGTKDGSKDGAKSAEPQSSASTVAAAAAKND
jgi:putative FmdB family regulatory protein